MTQRCACCMPSRGRPRGQRATYVSLFKERAADPFAQEPRRLHAADRLHPSDVGYAQWHRELSAQSGLSGVLH